MPVLESTADDTDLGYLRQAIALARHSRDGGNHPFGALLVGPDRQLLLQAGNTGRTEHDATGHAERNLMTAAARAYEAEFLAGCTMVTSAEPCAMCAGAMYWAGVGRVVYGLSEKRLGEIIGPHPENLTMDLPCRTVFAAGQRSISVAGPLLEDDAARDHIGFW